MSTEEIKIPSLQNRVLTRLTTAFRWKSHFQVPMEGPMRLPIRTLNYLWDKGSKFASWNWSHMPTILNQELKITLKTSNPFGIRHKEISLSDFRKLVAAIRECENTSKNEGKHADFRLDLSNASPKYKNLVDRYILHIDQMDWVGRHPRKSPIFPPRGKSITFVNLIIVFPKKQTSIKAEEQVKRAIDIRSPEKVDMSTISKIEFYNCIFFKNDDFNDPIIDVIFEKNEKESIIFTDCLIRNVKIQFLEYTKNIKNTDNTHEEIKNKCGEILFSNVYSISYSEFVTTAQICPSVLHVNHREHPVYDRFMSAIKLHNCFFYSVKVHPSFLAFFGGNTIKGIKFIEKEKQFPGGESIFVYNEWNEAIHPEVDWGVYDNIEPSGGDWFEHKMKLISFLRISEKNKDFFQVDVLKREIQKCDHALIKREPWRKSFQDRITFFFNKHVSNYGISWIRPIVFLALFNAAFAAGFHYYFLFWLKSPITFDDSALIFTQLFNPISTFDSLKIAGGGKLPETIRLAFTAALIFQKMIFALCTYEVIRAGRRFTRASSQ